MGCTHPLKPALFGLAFLFRVLTKEVTLASLKKIVSFKNYYAHEKPYCIVHIYSRA